MIKKDTISRVARVSVQIVNDKKREPFIVKQCLVMSYLLNSNKVSFLKQN